MRQKIESLPLEDRRRVVFPSTRMALDLYPYDDPFFRSRSPAGHSLSFFDSKDSGASLTGFNWSKRMGSASGTWTATVKARREIAALDIMSGEVLPGDWMDATIYCLGRPIPVCRGIVDGVRRNRKSTGGATVFLYTLTGRDHGAVFDSVLSFSSPWAQSLNQVVEGLYTERMRGNVGGDPSSMFSLLIDGMLGRSTLEASSWTLPNSMGASASTFREALQIVTSPTRGFTGNELQLWNNPGTTLHQALMTWCNPLLNEIFYDLIPPGSKRQMAATLRERPFINTTAGMNSPWFDLTEWEIPRWLVLEDDIGRSNQERFNVAVLVADQATMTAGEQTGLTRPVGDIGSFNAHGIRPYLETTRFINEAANPQGGWEVDRGVWLKLLLDWHAANAYWLSGMAKLGTAIPEIHIGDRVALVTDNEEETEHYYVEGVDIEYSFGSSGARSATSLVLTRGYKGPDKDALALVKSVSDQFVDLWENN